MSVKRTTIRINPENILIRNLFTPKKLNPVLSN